LIAASAVSFTRPQKSPAPVSDDAGGRQQKTPWTEKRSEGNKQQDSGEEADSADGLAIASKAVARL